MDKYQNTRQYRNKSVCVSCTERTLVVSFVILLYVCLCCVVPVSMHYRLYLVTVCMKMGDFSDFQRGQIVGLLLAGAYITKTAILLGVSRAAVSKVMTT